MIKRSDISVIRRKHVATPDDVLMGDLELHYHRYIDADCSEEDRASEADSMVDKFMDTIYGEIKVKVEEAMSMVGRLQHAGPDVQFQKCVLIHQKLSEIRSMCDGREP